MIINAFLNLVVPNRGIIKAGAQDESALPGHCQSIVVELILRTLLIVGRRGTLIYPF